MSDLPETAPADIADLGPNGWKPAGHSRERVLAVMLMRCEYLVGSQVVEGGTKARIRHILDNAKAAGVPAGDYRALHFLWRVLPTEAEAAG